MTLAIETLDAADLQDVCVRAGLSGRADVEPLVGGRNNRVYRLSAGADRALLKIYFRDANANRDRLGHEFQFVDYAWSHGVHVVPRPRLADYERSLGVYEFVDGVRLPLADVATSHVEQAARFHAAINDAARDDDDALRIPLAADACFSIASHLDAVHNRVLRLSEMVLDSDVAREARRFAVEVVEPFWHDLNARVSAAFSRTGLLTAELGRRERCLSPSDFGFHNALVEHDGAVRFLDFEDAGWDDPAKLVCDFSNQPDMLLSDDLGKTFETRVVERDTSPDQLRDRINWLRPVYQVKWVCIILNDFLPFGRTRAQFTGVSGDDNARRATQLEKARSMFGRAVHSLSQTGAL